MNKNVSFRQLSLLVAIFLAACSSSLEAASQMEVALQVKQQPVERNSGVTVIINNVSDNRQFSGDQAIDGSSTASSPDGQDQAFNRRLAGQVLGQKDEPHFLVVAENQNVAGLVGDAIAEAFRRAGYRVATSGSPDAVDAIKVNVELNRFWIWANANPEIKKSYYFNSEIEATIQADIPPFGLPTIVGADIRARGKRPKKDVSWVRTGNRGIEDLVKTTTVLLKYPPACAAN